MKNDWFPESIEDPVRDPTDPPVPDDEQLPLLYGFDLAEAEAAQFEELRDAVAHRET